MSDDQSQLSKREEVRFPKPPDAIRVMAVDDEPMVLESVRLLLEYDGINVVGAFSNAYDAVNSVERLAPDLVFMDFSMPGMKGDEAAFKMVQLRPETKVVLLTAFPPSVRPVGVVGMVIKPFYLATLRDAIARVLAGEILEWPAFGSTIGKAELDRLTPVLAEIVGAFCHDFGNDFTALQAADELVDDKLDRAFKKRLFAKMIDSLNDLHGLVRQFYKSDAAFLPIVTEETLREELQNMVAPDLAKSRCKLQVRTSGVLDTFAFPRPVLRHLLVPLITNAIEASSAIKPSKIVVTMSYDKALRELQSVVADNGPGWGGVPKDFAKRIRHGVPISTKGRNRGRGLINIHRITVKLGGQIFFSDNKPSGAKVELRIPLQK